jgi:hypothetical protein
MAQGHGRAALLEAKISNDDHIVPGGARHAPLSAALDDRRDGRLLHRPRRQQAGACLCPNFERSI